MQKCFGALSARAASYLSAIGLLLAADAWSGVSYEVTRIPTPAESTTSAALGVNASGEAVG